MKIKTIKKMLREKFDDFAKSIEDEPLRKSVEANTIITGGAIVSMLLKERVNDYDLYFKTKAVAMAVANYLVAKFKEKTKVTFAGNANREVLITVEDKGDRVHLLIKSAGVVSEGRSDYKYFESVADSEGEDWSNDAQKQVEELDEQQIDDAKTALEGKYRPVFMSSNAITLSNGVQCIVRFFGEPEDIHKNYDYLHCTCYWKSWDDELVTPVEALQCILTRELRYVGSKYPLCSIIRIRKFLSRGWTINAGQILKMVMQLNDLDLHNIEVLQDQMIGVDAAYFQQVLERLRDKDKDHVDTAYLMTVIDRIF